MAGPLLGKGAAHLVLQLRPQEVLAQPGLVTDQQFIPVRTLDPRGRGARFYKGVDSRVLVAIGRACTSSTHSAVCSASCFPRQPSRWERGAPHVAPMQLVHRGILLQNLEVAHRQPVAWPDLLFLNVLFVSMVN